MEIIDELKRLERVINESLTFESLDNIERDIIKFQEKRRVDLSKYLGMIKKRRQYFLNLHVVGLYPEKPRNKNYRDQGDGFYE